jgi:hypothetical protein
MSDLRDLKKILLRIFLSTIFLNIGNTAIYVLFLKRANIAITITQYKKKNAVSWMLR